MAVPKKDADLVNFVSNFSTRITADPSTFKLTAGDATQYASLSDPYVAAYNALIAARAAGNKSSSLTAVKDAAKGVLLPYARQLYTTVQSNLSVSDSDKLLLGIKVRAAHPTPAPAPSSSPALEIVSVTGWTVKIKLHSTEPGAGNGRPPGTVGAAVFSFVGDAPPGDIASWKFEGNTGKTTVDVVFDSSLAPGAKVWLTAFWFNNRKQSGPACAPVATNVQGGSVSSTDAMKLAA